MFVEFLCVVCLATGSCAFLASGRARRTRLAAAGLAVVAAAGAFGQTATTAPWLHKVQVGDLVYFAFGAPARVERYDVAQERWLASIPLPWAPTAFHADGQSLYLANERALYTRALDGSNEQPLYNAQVRIDGVLTDDSYVFVFQPGYASNRIDSLRKSDRQFIATWNGTYSLSGGFSLAPAQRRIYGVNTATTAFSTIELAYNANGTFGSTVEIWANGSFGDRPKTWVSPDERRLVRNLGVVYSIPQMTERGSLAGGIDDAAYHGSDILVALRGAKLVAFDGAYLESGTYSLPAAAHAIAVRNGQIFTFTDSGTETSGIAVQKVPVASLTAAQPGTPLDPQLLTFVPDESLAMEDGTLLLVSKKLQSIFHWSPATRRYIGSYPLLGTPAAVAYSPTLRRIYVGYSSGAINRLDLGGVSQVEVPFAALTSPVSILVAMDDHLLVGQGYSYYDFKVFDRFAQSTYTQSYGGYGSGHVWSSAQRRLYFTDFGRLQYYPVNAAGQLGTAVSGTYSSSSSSIELPMRLAADGATLAGRNGYVFRTSDLAYAGTLSNSVIDLVSAAGRWASIRAAGGETQLQAWSSSYFFDKGVTVPGVPLRIFALADGRLLVLTTSLGNPQGSYYELRNDGHVIFSVVDLGGAGSVTSSPVITGQPQSTTFYRGRAAALSVTAVGTALTYQWRRNGVTIAGATGSTLAVTAAADADAGTYAVLVGSAYGSVLSASATVTVQDPPAVPVIVSQPQPVSAWTGMTAGFSVAASGTGLTYQWRKDGVAVAGATSSYYSLTPVLASSYGSYTVMVSNAGGSVTSNPAALTTPPAPTITGQPQTVTVSVGSYASFSVSATSSGLTYQWRKDAAPIAGATSSYLVFSSVTAADYGVYDVVVTNPAGSVTSASVRLIAPLKFAAVNALVQVPAGGTVCSFVVQGSRTPKFLVRVSGPALQSLGLSGTHPDPRLELTNASGVLVGANNDWGTGNDLVELSAATLTAGGAPFASGSKDAAIVRTLSDGAYALVIAGDGTQAGRVLVEIFDLESPASSPNRIVYFAARGTIAEGLPLVAGLLPGARGTRSLLVRGWGPALGLAGSAANPSLTWSSTGIPTLTNDDWETGGAAGIKAVVAARGLTPFANGSADAALLPGSALEVQPYTATLTPVGAGAGETLLEIVDLEAVTSSGFPAVILASTPSQTVSEGTDLELRARLAASGPGTMYSWRKNGVVIAGATDAALLLRQVRPADAGSYAVLVAHGSWRAQSLPTILTVQPAAEGVHRATQTADGSYAPGGTVVITNTLTFAGAPTSLGWRVEIPAGWSYVGGSGEGDVKPVAGTTRVLEWAWSNVPASPLTFTYTLTVGLDSSGPQALTATALVRDISSLAAFHAAPNPLVLSMGTARHSADSDRNGRLGLTELTRVIELYNTRSGSVRTGAYKVDAASEDGFAADPSRSAGPAVLERYHSADSPSSAGGAVRDGTIDIFELTRVIQIYNYRSGTTRTGQYRVQPGTEDGFAPGP